MKIAIGSDHRGYELKEYIKKTVEGHEFVDFGTDSEDSCDYPDFAIKVAQSVAKGESERGILICATGIGMSITANKVRGAYAALVLNEKMAEFSRRHNNANIIVLPADLIEKDDAIKFIDIFMKTDFEGKRHARRFDKIREYENQLVDRKVFEKLQKELRKWQSRAWLR